MENIGVMGAWLRDRYASPVFNKCGHGPLHAQNYGERRIHVATGTRPYFTTAPAVVPARWRDRIRRSILRNVELGVIELAQGAPLWCHDMMVHEGPSGDPGWTVDLSRLGVQRWDVAPGRGTPGRGSDVPRPA